MLVKTQSQSIISHCRNLIRCNNSSSFHVTCFYNKVILKGPPHPIPYPNPSLNFLLYFITKLFQDLLYRFQDFFYMDLYEWALPLSIAFQLSHFHFMGFFLIFNCFKYFLVFGFLFFQGSQFFCWFQGFSFLLLIFRVFNYLKKIPSEFFFLLIFKILSFLLGHFFRVSFQFLNFFWDFFLGFKKFFGGFVLRFFLFKKLGFFQGFSLGFFLVFHGFFQQ